jgi:transcriptional regulator with GAF, ATPase, and Fis domain
MMNMPQTNPSRLLIVGDLTETMGLAAEMVQGADASIAVGTADCTALNNWCQSLGKMVVVDVTVNLPEVISRLRGDTGEAKNTGAAIKQLVGQSVYEVERALILQTLEKCQGNRTTAAGMLRISVRTIRNKLRSFLTEEVVTPPGLFRQ